MAKGGLEPPTTAYETDKLPYSTPPISFLDLEGVEPTTRYLQSILSTTL